MNHKIDNLQELVRRSLQETLGLFKDGEQKYMTDPVFTQTIDYLCLGGAPEKIIEQLIGIINIQREEIEKLLNK